VKDSGPGKNERGRVAGQEQTSAAEAAVMLRQLRHEWNSCPSRIGHERIFTQFWWRRPDATLTSSVDSEESRLSQIHPRESCLVSCTCVLKYDIARTRLDPDPNI